jgi:hypothetical protein
MASLGEQRQGMRANTRHHQQHDIGERHAQRDLEDSLGTTPAVGMHVHLLSVRASENRFNRGMEI